MSKRSNFKKMGTFKKDTVSAVINFAFDMTYGSKGEHRQSRSGGVISRGKKEIFLNTFQGKLSEYSVANILYKHIDFKEPDLSTHRLGIWEDADFQIGKYVIAVKSTKSYGNLILLESKDWTTDGKYTASVSEPRHYSHIVLARLRPDVDSILRTFRPNPNLEIVRSDLQTLLGSLEWDYDIPGFITSADLISIIQSGLVIPQNAILNGAVKMDAQNYYVQAGDLRPINELHFDLEG